MKLTDIDLSSLAEVAAAITLLDSVHVRLATGGVPLPSLPEFVVNPAPAPTFTPQGPLGSGDVVHIHGLGVDPVTAQPLDAATVFGRVTLGRGEFDPLPGATAQSAAPLPLVPFTAGASPSLTAPAAPPASGLAPLASPAPAPPPVASAAAPAAPAPHASRAGGVELDADGLPWDERIHAGTKRKTADGRWTAKRGINDPDLVPRVVAQLRAQMVAGSNDKRDINLALPGSLGAALGVPQMTLAQLQEAQQQANVTPPVQAQLAPLPVGKPTPTTFADFMTAATVEVQGGRLTALQFGEACKLYGGPAGLASHPAAIPTVWAALKAQCPGML